MTLAGGDMAQYDLIKRMGIGDYLIKLNNYVDDLERERQKHTVKPQHGRTK